MCRLDQLDQPSVLIALNGGKTALDQQIGGSPCFERAADVIPQVHDLRDAEGGNIRQHCFKRDAVAMNVGYRSEFHRTRFELATNDLDVQTRQPCGRRDRLDFLIDV
jgi:hypothetical protein